MPLYEFECPMCESIHEELVPTGTQFTPCKECDSVSQKIMSLSSFQLKGGGWEKDGYATTSKGKQ